MVGCSTCGRELAYIAQYDRHYCYSCRAYAPKDLRPCPTCGRALVYVPQYQRHYCYGCQEYKQPGAVAAAPQPARAGNPCPTCGRELTYIQQYNRHYCYNCKAYAPLKREALAAVPAAKPMAALGATSGPGAMAGVQVLPTEAVAATGGNLGALPARAGPAGAASTATVPVAASPSTKELPFTREELDAASKDQLMRWCQTYGLDPSGMKYELRLRLLEYIKAYNLALKGGPPNREGAPSDAPGARTEGAGTGEIVIEAITDDEEESKEGPATPSPVTTPATTAEAKPSTADAKPSAGSAMAAEPPSHPITVVDRAAGPSVTPTPAVQAAPSGPGPQASPTTAVAVKASEPSPSPTVTVVTEASRGVGLPAVGAVPASPSVMASPTVAGQGVPGCPRCGGVLNYISQYGRYYCYRCQAYAPAGWGAGVATVGAMATPQVAVARPVATATVTVPGFGQRPAAAAEQASALPLEVAHGGSRICLIMMGVGFFLYSLYEWLVRFPQEFSFDAPAIPDPVAFALRYTGMFIFAMGIGGFLWMIHNAMGKKL